MCSFCTGEQSNWRRLSRWSRFSEFDIDAASDAGASLPPADGIDAASLPKALDEELVAVQVLLGQEGTHLRPIPVKGQANRQH
jgi:hypothetical protein